MKNKLINKKIIISLLTLILLSAVLVFYILTSQEGNIKDKSTNSVNTTSNESNDNIVSEFLKTRPRSIDGLAMEPTLKSGEIYNFKLLLPDEKLKRDDIVIYYSKDLLVELVHRIIGLPGETIELDGDKIIIDGKLYKESYEVTQSIDLEFEFTDEKEFTLGLDEYFLVGDNRNLSYDSRIVGAIKREQISSILKD
ncbi:MAG: signal peptidase I [Candidatus Dojkabacteria bacterium]|nr:signal peptidase I [Candidatus Dojkabacteria bacterium]MDQ7021455.1 signal peptidase I [Candidatus Dojkabacteria bacterium]